MSADIRLLRWHERDREDYERLAAAIERVRAVAAQGRGEIVAPVPNGPEEPNDADRARALLAQRRRRDAAAGPLAELFGEPGWDVLLTLFIAFEDGQPLRPSQIGQSVEIRPAVLARWIQVLLSRELVWTADPGDADAALSLTDAGVLLALACVSDA